MTDTRTSPITTHVLDIALGQPARGLAVELAVESKPGGDAGAGDRTGDAGGWTAIATRSTDAAGRVGDLLAPGALATRTYRLTFDTGAYFRAAGRPVFYPRVEVIFTVAAPEEHHHIPLLLSPFGYSTYRGS